MWLSFLETDWCGVMCKRLTEECVLRRKGMWGLAGVGGKLNAGSRVKTSYSLVLQGTLEREITQEISISSGKGPAFCSHLSIIHFQQLSPTVRGGILSCQQWPFSREGESSVLLGTSVHSTNGWLCWPHKRGTGRVPRISFLEELEGGDSLGFNWLQLPSVHWLSFFRVSAASSFKLNLLL